MGVFHSNGNDDDRSDKTPQAAPLSATSNFVHCHNVIKQDKRHVPLISEPPSPMWQKKLNMKRVLSFRRHAQFLCRRARTWEERKTERFVVSGEREREREFSRFEPHLVHGVSGVRPIRIGSNKSIHTRIVVWIVESLIKGCKFHCHCGAFQRFVSSVNWPPVKGHTLGNRHWPH